MTARIDIDQFALDYREGVNDRQLLQKYGINSQEMIAAVKKLISEGKITRQDYFNRKKKIEEYESRQERDFLKSLYQCPVCGHIQPTPFKVCPACETDISDRRETKTWYDLKHAYDQSAKTPESPRVLDVPKVRAPSAVVAAHPVTAPPVQKPPNTAAPPPKPEESPSTELDPYQAVIGMTLEDLIILPGVPKDRYSGDYVITSVVKTGDRAVVFKGEDSRDEALPVAVKVFNPELGEESDVRKDSGQDYRVSIDHDKS